MWLLTVLCFLKKLGSAEDFVKKIVWYRSENQPAEATDRCLSCPLSATCPYSAEKIYLANPYRGYVPYDFTRPLYQVE